MKTLFDQPSSHTKDPQTSYEAAEKVIKSGKFQYSVEQVREAITRYCKVFGFEFTAKEVADFISKEDKIDYYPLYIIIQKRKSVLENQGFLIITDRESNDCCVCEKLRS